MIARYWKARTKPGMGESYLDYFRRTGLKDFQATPGFVHAYTFRRDVGDVSDYVILSFWTDLDAVRAFAGADAERAVYYEGDVDYFPVEELRTGLENYEIVLDQAADRIAPASGGAEAARRTA